MSLDGERWISSRPNYFLPVQKLSQVFRGTLLEALELALVEERLRTSEAAGRLLLRQAAAQDFVVYSKPPLAGPEQVLRYLGRYTHRIAIGGERLIAHREGQVTFSYKDRKHGGRRKTLTLPGAEFARRFLLHASPGASSGYATSVCSPTVSRSTAWPGHASLLGMPAPKEPSQAEPESWQDTYRRLLGREPLPGRGGRDPPGIARTRVSAGTEVSVSRQDSFSEPRLRQSTLNVCVLVRLRSSLSRSALQSTPQTPTGVLPSPSHPLPRRQIPAPAPASSGYNPHSVRPAV